VLLVRHCAEQAAALGCTLLKLMKPLGRLQQIRLASFTAVEHAPGPGMGGSGSPCGGGGGGGGGGEGGRGPGGGAGGCGGGGGGGGPGEGQAGASGSSLRPSATARAPDELQLRSGWRNFANSRASSRRWQSKPGGCGGPSRSRATASGAMHAMAQSASRGAITRRADGTGSIWGKGR
jgi:hypothetical protein